MKREMRKCSPTNRKFWEVGKLEIQDMVSVMKQQYSDNQKTLSQQIQTRSNFCFLKKRKNGHLFQPFQAVLQKLVDCWEDSNSPAMAWSPLPNSSELRCFGHHLSLHHGSVEHAKQHGLRRSSGCQASGEFGNQLHSTQSIASKDDKHSYNVYPLFDIYHTDDHLP